MGIFYVLIAALFAGTVNLCLRKNLEQQKSPQGYLAVYFIFSLASAFLLRKIDFASFSFVMSSVGALAGMLNFLMMLLLARCLQIGPAGLTFAFQNSSSVLPSLLLFFLFGSSFGFALTWPLLSGFGLIISGLFLSSRMKKEPSASHQYSFNKWLSLAVSIFFIQGLILFLMQWRCLLLSDQVPSNALIPWKCSEQEDVWFMPGFFLLPAILQSLIFWISEKRWFSKREFLLATAGGLLNGGATFFLLLATKEASSGEKMILFPLFAVTVILLCNLWGKKLYKEQIHWPGMALCLAGTFLGSLGI